MKRALPIILIIISIAIFTYTIFTTKENNEVVVVYNNTTLFKPNSLIIRFNKPCNLKDSVDVIFNSDTTRMRYDILLSEILAESIPDILITGNANYYYPDGNEPYAWNNMLREILEPKQILKRRKL
jgi:hypothetical protein